MRKIKRIIQYIVLSVISLLSIFPFIWMIIGATNSSVDITKGKLSFGTSLLTNINNLFVTSNIKVGIINSFKISIATTLLGLFISSLAGYAFEIYKSRRKDRILSTLLISMMIPFTALVIPLYTMFAKLKMLNTSISVIIPYVATAFLIFFFKQNTIAFSKNTIEAARIDGLSEIKIFYKIYIPIMKSTYSAAAIITFMASWNNYLWPLVALTSSDKQTLPIVISSLGSSYAPDFGIIMVGIIISTLPTALLFFLMQKNFVEGMVGSVK